MDAVDFWTSEVPSTKPFPLLQPLEGDDDDEKAYFPCPFCDVEIELQVLCSHMEEDHFFEVKNEVCPLCAENLGEDAIGHFTKQHEQSVKRKKQTQTSTFLTYGTPVFAKTFSELSSLFVSFTKNNRANEEETAPDPLLTPFLHNFSLSDPIVNQEDDCSTNAAPTTSGVKSTKPPLLGEVQREEDYEEKNKRANFLQDLIMSTMF